MPKCWISICFLRCFFTFLNTSGSWRAHTPLEISLIPRETFLQYRKMMCDTCGPNRLFHLYQSVWFTEDLSNFGHFFVNVSKFWSHDKLLWLLLYSIYNNTENSHQDRKYEPTEIKIRTYLSNPEAKFKNVIVSDVIDPLIISAVQSTSSMNHWYSLISVNNPT